MQDSGNTRALTMVQKPRAVNPGGSKALDRQRAPITGHRPPVPGRRSSAALAALLLSLHVLSPARAAEPPLDDPNQPYDQFSMEVVTPHVAWARPSVTGPLKALVIAPCWQFRDTVELAQRLDLNVTPLMVALNTAYYGAGESMQDLDGDLDRLAQLRLSDERQYNVIVIGKVLWNVLPDPVREAILRKVARGTGLVYVSPAGADDALKKALAARQPDAEAALLAGVPTAVMPLTLEKGDIYTPAIGPFELRLSTFGQGRVAAVDYRDVEPEMNKWGKAHWATPFQLGDGPWYDYYFAIVARAAQWAGRRELPVRVVPATTQGAAVARTKLAAGPVTFALAAPPELAGPATLRWRLRNVRNEAVFSKQAPIRLAAAQTVAEPLPALAAGLYVLDLWVTIDGRTAGWGSAAFNVTAPAVLGEVRMTQSARALGEPLTGTVTLRAPLPKGQRLTVTARDRLGRLVAEASPKAGGMAAPFALPMRAPLGCIFDVRATVGDDAGPVEEAACEAFVPNPRRDNFMFTQWGSPSDDPLARAATEQMQRVGGLTGYYDSVLYSSLWTAVRPVALAGARQGLRPLPYCATYIIPADQYAETVDGLALKRDGLWSGQDFNNPACLPQASSNMAAFARAYVGCDVVAWSISEEGGVPQGESCFCDFCKPAFVAYARRKYTTLEAANHAWGTTYASWEAVRGGTRNDVERTGRYERWLDQRLFMIEGYNRWQRACIEGFRSVDPEARVGPHVVVGVDRSFDIPAMGPEWGTFGLCNDYMDAVPRSFLPRGSLAENEAGNLPMEEDFHRHWPWHALLQGQTHIFWYPRFHSHGLGGIATLFPDLRPFACYRQTGDEVREIQRGLGPLLIQGEMVRSPVAVHWSTLSALLDDVHHPETRWLDSLRDAFHAVADAGFVYHYLGTPQIENGALADAKVLLLPYSQALTGREADAIRAFVRDGGLLFADFLPGVFDANGTRLPRSLLADVFTNTTELAVNAFGRGHAVLTGGSLKGYTGRRGTGDAGDRRGLTRMMASLAGVEPWCRVEHPNGLDRGDTEITVFRNGASLFLGLLRDPGVRADLAGAGGAWVVRREPRRDEALGAMETVVHLPATYHVYDARRQDYLGATNRIDTGLVKARATVFALLPCKLTGLTLKAGFAKPRQGDLLELTAGIQPAAAATCGLAVRFAVTGPDGVEREEYARTLVMRDGQLQTAIGLALDEPPGAYRVTATEVLSGLTTSCDYRVEKR